jgi:hypothetical protein
VQTEGLAVLVRHPPLHTRVAADRLGSLTVLRRNGFRVVAGRIRTRRGVNREVDELQLPLDP